MENLTVDKEILDIETKYNGIIDDTVEIQAKEEKVIIEYEK